MIVLVLLFLTSAFSMEGTPCRDKSTLTPGATWKPTICVCKAAGDICSATIPCCETNRCDLSTGLWGRCPAYIGTRPSTTSTARTSRPPATTTVTQRKYLITQHEFNAAVTNDPIYKFPRPTDAQWYNFISRATPSENIATKRELAMFLANILHESDGLRAKAEYGGLSRNYSSLACDLPGKRYYGRGYIQLTWCYNYMSASTALYGDHRLVEDPDQVALNETIAWDVSFWYWAARVRNAPGIQEGRFGVSIARINGGQECNETPRNPQGARKRWQLYKTVYAAFGLTGLTLNNSLGCWTKNQQPIPITGAVQSVGSFLVGFGPNSL